MQQFHQLVFIFSLLAICWLSMLIFHELGHVIGALVTGGKVQKVVLHPLTISRTDVSPNPLPTFVVWLGPILGCLLPASCWLMLPKSFVYTRMVVQFFVGFCLIANGAYIAFGAFDGIGDCGELLRLGSPLWTLFAFGAVTIPSGLYCWHCLGSIQHFLVTPESQSKVRAYIYLLALFILATMLITVTC